MLKALNNSADWNVNVVLPIHGLGCQDELEDFNGLGHRKVVRNGLNTPRSCCDGS